MRDRKLKIRLFFDYEKEEKWVNLMAEKGWNLTSFGIGYFTFAKGEPGQYIYRNEMIYELGSKGESREYIEFLEVSGIELVKKRFNWAYFRKHATDGPFELYSDTSSKLAYLNRLFYLFTAIPILNLFIAVINITLLNIHQKNSINDFMGGVNTGMAIILLYPIVNLIRKRRDLKKHLEIFND